MNRTKHTTMQITAVLLTMLIVSTFSVFADAKDSGTVVPSDSEVTLLPASGTLDGGMEDRADGSSALPDKDSFRVIYRAIKNIGTSLGALGAAFCGFEYLKGNDAEGERAIKRLIVILIAVAALYLVPAVAGFGVDLASGIKWNPPDISQISISDRT